MPIKPKPKPLSPKSPPLSSPLQVARMSVEEQIGSLFHWSEGFADWRLQVDERLECGEENFRELSKKVDGVDHKLGDLAHKMEERHSQLILIQQQVLMVVQGQRIPGMERPGLTDDLKAVATELAGLKTLYGDLKASDTSRKGWVAGVATVVTLVGGAIATYFYETFHTLLIFVNHLPPVKP